MKGKTPKLYVKGTYNLEQTERTRFLQRKGMAADMIFLSRLVKTAKKGRTEEPCHRVPEGRGSFINA